MKFYRLFLFITAISFWGSGMAQNWKESYDSTKVYWDNDWSKTLEFLKKSVPPDSSQIYYSTYPVVLNDIGVCYMELGEYVLADSVLRLSLMQKAQDIRLFGTDYLFTKLNYATLKEKTGDFTDAERLLTEVIEEARDLKGSYSDIILQAYAHKGRMMMRLSEWAKAQNNLENALNVAIALSMENSTRYSELLVDLSSVYLQNGYYQLADRIIDKAIAISRSVVGEKHPLYMNAYHGKGLIELSLGRYGDAETILLEVNEFTELYYGTDHIKYGESLNNLGNLYRKMGIFDKAQSYYQQAIDQYQRYEGDKTELAQIYNNMAGFYLKNRSFENAEDLYQKAALLISETYGEYNHNYTNILQNLGTLYRQKGDLNKAEEYYKKVLNIENERLTEINIPYLVTLSNLALLYVAKAEFKNAEGLLKNVITLERSMLGDDHPSITNMQNNLGLLYFGQKQYNKSKPLLDKAIDNRMKHISYIFPSLSEKEKEEFYNLLREDIERYFVFAIETLDKYPEVTGRIYDLQLNTKGILFKNAKKVREKILSSGDQRLIEDYREFKELRDRLGYYYRLGRSQALYRKVNLDSLQNALNRLEKRITRQSEEYDDLTYETSSWKDIQRKLKKGEVAIEMLKFREFRLSPKTHVDVGDQMFFNYGFTDNSYYVALIITPDTKDQPEYVIFENGAEMDTRLFYYYRNAIRFDVKDEISYENFWEPVQRRLDKMGNYDKIYFAPDGVYHLLNLNTLSLPKGKYLLDSMDISYLISTRNIGAKNSVQLQDSTAVLVGDISYANQQGWWELPGAAEEIYEVAQLKMFNGWDTTLYVGENANEASVKTVEDPGIIHFATHGYFSGDQLNSDNLLFGRMSASGLVLDKPETVADNNYFDSEVYDGKLTAYEVMNLNLDNTYLVTLSACETGLGLLQHGEGVYGLQRAFMGAGARNVLQSLWQIDDEASRKLMIHFYKNWNDGMSLQEALRSSQLEIMKEYPQPYYWGSFVLVADF